MVSSAAASGQQNPQGAGYKATHLNELVDNNVQAVLLHVQSLGLISRFQDLKEGKQ